MKIEFEELDYQPTPIGAVSLRRRTELSLRETVYEIKLDEEFLMSSLFTASEIALARLGLGALDKENISVVVGGLGLGYTAATVLDDARVSALHVVEALSPVIEWHRRHLLPLGPTLTFDSRCRLVHGDFFKLARSPEGFLADAPKARFDAILVDIDHSPQNVLDAAHESFYTAQGLHALVAHLEPGGVFALWSNDPPDELFVALLTEVFESAKAHVVAFPNPYTGGESACTVYVAVATGRGSGHCA